VVRPFKPIQTGNAHAQRGHSAAVGEQFYENATVLYLKPGVLTRTVDDIASRIKGAGKSRKILLDLRDTTATQNRCAPGQLLHQARNPGVARGQKYPLQTFSADPSLPDRRASAVLVNRGTYGAPELRCAMKTLSR